MDSSSTDGLKSFPLSCLLILYINCIHDCYINYHEGFKLLHEWLSPIKIPTGYDEPMPEIFSNWEFQELAKIVGTKPHIIYNLYREIYYG